VATGDLLGKTFFGASLGLPWIGLALECGVTLAGALDLVETISLAFVLHGPVEQRWLGVADLCARVKFALLWGALAYGVVGAGCWICTVGLPGLFLHFRRPLT
jgi:hypothetical protein